jgi:AraC-like DNA-binding protein
MSIHIQTSLSGARLGAIAGLSQPVAELVHHQFGVTLSATRLRGLSYNFRPVRLATERAISLLVDLRNRATAILDLRTEHTFDFGRSPDYVAVYLPIDGLISGDDAASGGFTLLSPRLDTTDEQFYSLSQCLSGLLERGDTLPLVLGGLFDAIRAHLLQTYRAAAAPSFAIGGLAPWQLKRARTLLAGDLTSAPSISVVAGYCRLSTSHFTRAFRRSTGLSPHQWLIQQRVAHAKALLRDCGLPLASVALECGFADQSHFTRAFSSCEGISPGRWRRDQGIGDGEDLQTAA